MKKVSFVVLFLQLLVPFASRADTDEDQAVKTGARVRLLAPAPQPVFGARVPDENSGENNETFSFQSAGELVPRTYTQRGQTVTGTLISVTEGSIMIQTSRDQRNIRVPREALTEFEVSVAPSRKKRGARIGGLVGLGAALVLAAIVADESKRWGGFGWTFAAASLWFVPSGLAVGAIVAPGERWRSTTLEQAGVGGFSASRVGASFTVRF